MMMMMMMVEGFYLLQGIDSVGCVRICRTVVGHLIGLRLSLLLKLLLVVERLLLLLLLLVGRRKVPRCVVVG